MPATYQPVGLSGAAVDGPDHDGSPLAYALRMRRKTASAPP